jgi:hypothetical protein
MSRISDDGLSTQWFESHQKVPLVRSIVYKCLTNMMEFIVSANGEKRIAISCSGALYEIDCPFFIPLAETVVSCVCVHHRINIQFLWITRSIANFQLLLSKLWCDAKTMARPTNWTRFLQCSTCLLKTSPEEQVILNQCSLYSTIQLAQCLLRFRECSL